MKRSLNSSLKNKTENYLSLSEQDKLDLITVLYQDYKLSWKQIGNLCGVSYNTVRRLAIKHGCQSRTKEEAQSIALQEGRATIPTEGGHKETTKIKISEGVAKSWDELSDEDRESRRQDSKKRWSEKTEEEIREFNRAGGDAIRKAAKEGSALEKFLLRECIKAGYKVEFHKEHWVIRESLQIDLYFPELKVALEVDGPSHFKDIWGKGALAKSKRRDLEKSGLLLQRGCVIIRVRQKQALSQKYKRDVLASVLRCLNQIKHKRPVGGERVIILGDKE